MDLTIDNYCTGQTVRTRDIKYRVRQSLTFSDIFVAGCSDSDKASGHTDSCIRNETKKKYENCGVKEK